MTNRVIFFILVSVILVLFCSQRSGSLDPSRIHLYASSKECLHFVCHVISNRYPITGELSMTRWQRHQSRLSRCQFSTQPLVLWICYFCSANIFFILKVTPPFVKWQRSKFDKKTKKIMKPAKDIPPSAKHILYAISSNKNIQFVYFIKFCSKLLCPYSRRTFIYIYSEL